MSAPAKIAASTQTAETAVLRTRPAARRTDPAPLEGDDESSAEAPPVRRKIDRANVAAPAANPPPAGTPQIKTKNSENKKRNKREYKNPFLLFPYKFFNAQK